MIALLDVGNTRAKWGLWSAGQWQTRGATQSADLAPLIGVLQAGRPSWVGVSCVAGESVRGTLTAALQALGCPIHWLQAAAHAHGLENTYEAPERLGSDRYAMLLACHRLGLAPCVVVGAGTALTADALDQDGRFLGGIILPGTTLMRQALLDGTDGVRAVQGRVTGFPRATADAVETGIGLAVSGAVHGMRQRLQQHLGAPVGVVVSGGDAAMVAGDLDAPVRVIEELVLEGLVWVARDLAVQGV